MCMYFRVTVSGQLRCNSAGAIHTVFEIGLSLWPVAYWVREAGSAFLCLVCAITPVFLHVCWGWNFDSRVWDTNQGCC